jgi:uncharacterized OsmC-like protein
MLSAIWTHCPRLHHGEHLDEGEHLYEEGGEVVTETPVRRFEAAARSTETFGRVLCTCRNHHFIVDGPVQNGCPGEELTPTELFISAVASCGVELIQVIAREKSFPHPTVSVKIQGMVDRARQPRDDVTVPTEVRLELKLSGVSRDQARELVESFKRR